MSALQHQLEAAVKAPSPVVPMLALCRAWALAPSSRVARLARGFARQLQVDPVPGANQEQREAGWLELAARASPADLQELLATPWSQKPKDAARRLTFLARLGPDPRIVGSLLELDTGNRYPSTAGHRFWQDVYELPLRWGSVEAVERVPKDLPASEHTSAGMGTGGCVSSATRGGSSPGCRSRWGTSCSRASRSRWRAWIATN